MKQTSHSTSRIGDFIDDVLDLLMIDAIFEGIGSILILIFEAL